MSSSEIDSNEIPPVVIVSLNISEANSTINGTRGRIFEKTPTRDTSFSNIYIGIGIVIVILIGLLVIIKLLRLCYKAYQSKSSEDDKQDPTQKSPLNSTSITPVGVRRNSSVRNPLVPTHRSSLNLETQIALHQKRFSGVYHDTPPTNKRT